MFKKIDSDDYVVTPYTASKSYSIPYDVSTDGQTDPTKTISVYQAVKTPPPFLEEQYSNPSLRNGPDGPYKKMLFDLINHFYYKYQADYNKFGVESYKDINLSSFDDSTTRVWVVKVSPKRYGEKIKPGSVVFEFENADSDDPFQIVDDGNGNLYAENGVLVGNVFYANGVLVLTKRVADTSQGNGAYTYFPSYAQFSQESFDFKSYQKFTFKFSNQVTLYDHEVRCTVDQHEFNGVTNPSVKKSDGSLVEYYQSNSFSPYITTVGLYDEFLNLVAIGKLSSPVQKPKNTPLTINVKFDT